MHACITYTISNLKKSKSENILEAFYYAKQPSGNLKSIFFFVILSLENECICSLDLTFILSFLDQATPVSKDLPSVLANRNTQLVWVFEC